MTAETRARRFWISFILSFFVAQAVLWTTALHLVPKDGPGAAEVER